MFCPLCGEKLKLEEDKKINLLLKTVDYFFAKCRKKHEWQVEIDYEDDNRVVLRELKAFDD